MKIEKLNEDKIRITFNNLDLQENNIDVHSFMANSIESQSLFLNMLDEAEREIGFITDNYKLSIDAIALNNGTFIITVTRIEKEILKSTRVQAYRQNIKSSNNLVIYRFLNFDDFCNFANFLSVSIPQFNNDFSISNSLYQYNHQFFLILQNMNNEYSSIISNALSEFAISVQNPELTVYRIKEYGTLVSENALNFSLDIYKQ